MCGIAGFIGGDWPGSERAGAILASMGAAVRHRGPDHSDIWMDPGSGLGFSHTRLSILELSQAGNQPMHSHGGRFVIVYNGEIYNHGQIREELAASGRAPGWRGHSDTETLLAAIEAWGVAGALRRVSGMFAFALWDKSERLLVLARDRLGEKPLYYGRQDGPGTPFLFASELKALVRHPGFDREVDRDALTLLLRYNYIPAPFSIYRGIAKLLPGSFLTLRASATEPSVETYWSGASVAEAGACDPLDIGDEDAVKELERRLEQAVGRQMLADVPVGAFLSGGIDSSAVVTTMQKLSPAPVKTFTIGFHEERTDEARYARAVAKHLGTDHNELYVSSRGARAAIPLMPQVYDEPFADSSQVPTYLLAALAKQQVKVALTGDGGDEIFGGYNRYLYSAELWPRIAAIPAPLRSVAAKVLCAFPRSAWNRFGDVAGSMTRSLTQGDRLGDLVYKGAGLVGSRSLDELYRHALCQWRSPESVVIGGSEPRTVATGAAPPLAKLDAVERMMALDMIGYLSDDLLTKVDRAAMAVSLETRTPLLDHELVEFAWKLPRRMKIRNAKTKWIVRQLLYRHMPEELIERPKMGFGIPLDEWLRGPLRDWAESLLDADRLGREGYLRPDPIRRLWTAHLRGRIDAHHHLWSILMFQSWLEAQSATASDTEIAAATAA